MKKLLILAFPLLFISCANFKIVPIGGDGMIKPSHPYIKYYGRFDFSKPDKAVFDWPGCTMALSFEGTSVKLLLDDGGNNYNIFIDNRPPVTLVTQKGVKEYTLASGLADGLHTVMVNRRTEAGNGVATFEGFKIDENKSVHFWPKSPKYKIEFIGDSLTVGYGNMCSNVNETDLRAMSDNYMSWGPIACRAVDAEWSIIAISGKGVVRNYGDTSKASKGVLPYYYDRALMANPKAKWSSAEWKADLVVINLGTNDVSTEPKPDKGDFIKGYRDLIAAVRGFYPEAKLLLCVSPMNQDTLKPWIEEIAAAEKADFLVLPTLSQTEMSGCQWHPTVAGHQKMADKLIIKLNEILK